MKLIDRHDDPLRTPRITDAVIHKCTCRCICENERLRSQRTCTYCFLMDHEGDSLIGPPKPSRLAEQRVYLLNDGGYEIR